MRYQNKDTLIHGIHPAYKLCYSLAISFLIVFLQTPAQLAVIAAVSVLIFMLTKPSFNQMKPILYFVGIVVLSTAFSQAVFYYFEPKTKILTLIDKNFPVVGTLTGGIYVYKEGIVYGLIQSLRIIAAMFMAATLVVTTHPSRMITTLNKLGFPKNISFVLAVSIRFFPQILDETKRILLALRLKGFKTSGIRNVLKTFSLVFVPLIINSFRQARVLALAAETRGFSAYSTHDGKRQSRPFFSTLDLITIAFSVVFLYVAILPFKMGLSRVPFLHPFFFSIPFTCILMIAVRLIPKLGSVTLLICGNSLFAQIISRGINPLWWPYALAESLSLEVYFFLTRNYAATATNTIFAGALRGAVVYLYFYYISSPYIWHKFYAPWYIAVYTIEGVIGSALGGLLGYKISNFVEKAYRYGGL